MSNYRTYCARLISLLDGDILPLPLPTLDIDCEKQDAEDDERIAIAVCENNPDLGWDRWDRLDESARKVWIERTIAALEKKAVAPPSALSFDAEDVADVVPAPAQPEPQPPAAAPEPIEASEAPTVAEEVSAPAPPPPEAQPPADDDYLPAELPSECAKRIGVHRTTLNRYIADGTVRCRKVTGHRWQLHRDDVKTLGGSLD